MMNNARMMDLINAFVAFRSAVRVLNLKIGRGEITKDEFAEAIEKECKDADVVIAYFQKHVSHVSDVSAG